jgi:type VI secretion system protein ImpF
VSADPLYEKLSRRLRRDSPEAVIGRHLVELMNCAIRGARGGVPDHSPAASSVLNYGCPPMQAPGSIRIDPVRTAWHIGEVIRRFEPRVDGTRISVQPRPDCFRRKPQTLCFDVLMTSRGDGSGIKVSLELDYLSGFFSLAGNA